MKFSYTNKRLYSNLVLGILWTIIGSSYFFDRENMRWNHYLFIVLGILYLLMFTYEYLNKYFEINKDKIKLLSIPYKEIYLNEVTEAKYYAGDYTLKTANKTLKIVKSQIKNNERQKFEDFFNEIKNRIQKKGD